MFRYADTLFVQTIRTIPSNANHPISGPQKFCIICEVISPGMVISIRPSPINPPVVTSERRKRELVAPMKPKVMNIGMKKSRRDCFDDTIFLLLHK